MELEKFYEAIDDFNFYLAENPLAIEAYFNRGIAYNKCGSYDFALRDLNKTIEINPNHEKAFLRDRL